MRFPPRSFYFYSICVPKVGPHLPESFCTPRARRDQKVTPGPVHSAPPLDSEFTRGGPCRRRGTAEGATIARAPSSSCASSSPRSTHRSPRDSPSRASTLSISTATPHPSVSHVHFPHPRGSRLRSRHTRVCGTPYVTRAPAQSQPKAASAGTTFSMMTQRIHNDPASHGDLMSMNIDNSPEDLAPIHPGVAGISHALALPTHAAVRPARHEGPRLWPPAPTSHWLASWHCCCVG